MVLPKMLNGLRQHRSRLRKKAARGRMSDATKLRKGGRMSGELKSVLVQYIGDEEKDT